MTEALFSMDEAPKGGVSLLVLLAVGEFFLMDEWQTYQSDQGFLPIPVDASSKAVAECAEKWLSRCSDEDVAAVVRETLKRRGVRAALLAAVKGTYDPKDGSHLINVACVRDGLMRLVEEPTDD